MYKLIIYIYIYVCVCVCEAQIPRIKDNHHIGSTVR